MIEFEVWCCIKSSIEKNKRNVRKKKTSEDKIVLNIYVLDRTLLV